MQAVSLIQPNLVPGPSTGANVGVPGTASGAGQAVESPAVPASDTLTLSSTNIVVARQVLTKQIDIALNINSPAAVPGDTAGRSGLPGSDGFGQNLANKVVQKFHNDLSSDQGHDSDPDHRNNAAKTVSLQVSQGFEQTSAIVNRLGLNSEMVTGDIAQTRAQVDQAIDQEVTRLTSETNTAAAFAASTKRELSTSLQVTTQDGDVVTIDLTRSQGLIAATASDDNGSLAYVGASSSTQIDFTVQGDLSNKERESIDKVIEQVSELAQKVFNGKAGAAMERLSEFKIDTLQLAGVSLSMSSSVTQQAVGVYAQVSRMQVDSPASAQVANPSNGTSTPAAGSGTGSTPVHNDVRGDQPPVIQSTQEPVADIAKQVVQDAAEVVNVASSSGSFENPFNEVSKLFAQIADLFTLDNHRISNDHKDFVKALFGDVVEMLEHDQKLQDGDDSIGSILES